jgi:hypothetical protein
VVSEKSVVRRGPICGFSIIEIQDENGVALRWEVRGAGKKLIKSCGSLAAALLIFQAMVDKVNNGLLLPGGADVQKQEDPADSSEPDDIPGQK